jgi:hypothetical protein
MADINSDKFLSDGNTFTFPVCNQCKWYNGDGYCEAFPQGIPDQILNGENNHIEPLLQQDNEIIFEPKNE